MVINEKMHYIHLLRILVVVFVDMNRPMVIHANEDWIARICLINLFLAMFMDVGEDESSDPKLQGTEGAFDETDSDVAIHSQENSLISCKRGELKVYGT